MLSLFCPLLILRESPLTLKRKSQKQVRHKLNEHVWLNVNATPQYRESEEKPFRVYSTFEDITERRNAETEIKKAKVEAERANVAKSEFLSRMSHELRTPMNSILGFAQLMNMGELVPAQKKGVDHILKSGKHLLDLINKVLDLSRIEAGEHSISIEPVQIRGIVAETMDVVKLLATTRYITFEFSESPVSDLFVKADPQKLKQVLLNLLSNAVKYNREGGSVTIKCSKLQVPNSRYNVAESKLETWNLKPLESASPIPEKELLPNTWTSCLILSSGLVLKFRKLKAPDLALLFLKN